MADGGIRRIDPRGSARAQRTSELQTHLADADATAAAEVTDAAPVVASIPTADAPKIEPDSVVDLEREALLVDPSGFAESIDEPTTLDPFTGLGDPLQGVSSGSDLEDVPGGSFGDTLDALRDAREGGGGDAELDAKLGSGQLSSESGLEQVSSSEGWLSDTTAYGWHDHDAQESRSDGDIVMQNGFWDSVAGDFDNAQVGMHDHNTQQSYPLPRGDETDDSSLTTGDETDSSALIAPLLGRETYRQVRQFDALGGSASQPDVDGEVGAGDGTIIGDPTGGGYTDGGFDDVGTTTSTVDVGAIFNRAGPETDNTWDGGDTGGTGGFDGDDDGLGSDDTFTPDQ